MTHENTNLKSDIKHETHKAIYHALILNFIEGYCKVSCFTKAGYCVADAFTRSTKPLCCFKAFWLAWPFESGHLRLEPMVFMCWRFVMSPHISSWCFSKPNDYIQTLFVSFCFKFCLVSFTLFVLKVKSFSFLIGWDAFVLIINDEWNRLWNVQVFYLGLICTLKSL